MCTKVVNVVQFVDMVVEYLENGVHQVHFL